MIMLNIRLRLHFCVQKLTFLTWINPKLSWKVNPVYSIVWAVYQRLTGDIIWLKQHLCLYNHACKQDSQVEWPLPAHLDLYQIVRPSSRSRKCRCFFHERDFTFLRVDPAIITLTWGSSWIPAQSCKRSKVTITLSTDSPITDSLYLIINLQTNSKIIFGLSK